MNCHNENGPDRQPIELIYNWQIDPEYRFVIEPEDPADIPIEYGIALHDGGRIVFLKRDGPEWLVVDEAYGNQTLTCAVEEFIRKRGLSHRYKGIGK